MRLQQLLEIIQTERKARETDISFDTGKIYQKMTRGGKQHPSGKSGMFARVYSAGNPHTVVKTNHIPIPEETDSYLRYIRYISDNNLASKNPFFPRIYNIKYLEDLHGNVKYRVEMESLHELNSLDDQVLTALLHTLFSPEDYAYMQELNLGLRKTLGSMISRVVTGVLKSKSKSLNDAGAIIRKVRDESGATYDVHSENIMIRLSPIPQLVITDPLA